MVRTALRSDTPLMAAMRIRWATCLRPARMPDVRTDPHYGCALPVVPKAC